MRDPDIRRSCRWTVAGLSKRRLILMIVIVTLLAAGLRLVGIGRESLWNDELSSWYRSGFSSLSEVVSIGSVSDVHPPAHNILLFFVQRTLGDSETALRLPSAICGILSVPVLFILGCMLFNRFTGLLSATLLAVSPTHIYFSQEARPYAVLILAALVSVYLLTLALRRMLDGERPGIPLLAGLLANMVLLEYLHYFGLLIAVLELAALVTVALVRRKGRFVSGALCILTAAAYIPWIQIATKQAGGGSYITRPGLSTIADSVRLLSGWSGLTALAITGISTTGLAAILLRRRSVDRLALLTTLSWAVLPFAIALLVSYLVIPVLTPRNLLISLPAVLLLVSMSVDILFRPGFQRMFISSVLIVLSLVVLIPLRQHYVGIHKQQFREVGSLVADSLDEENGYLLAASCWNPAYFNYYLDEHAPGVGVDIEARGPGDLLVIKELVQQRDPGQLWLLWGHLYPDSSLLDSLRSLFGEPEYFGYHTAGAWLYHP